MRVLVTGGAGFIGSNIAEYMVERGHEVIVLDNFLLGSRKNLEKIKNSIEIVNGDIKDRNLVFKITRNVDAVLNNAAVSSSPKVRENLTEAVNVNITGFVNILDAARKNNIKRVIYASTSSIYGNNKPPLKENMKTEPVNFYASTKLINEHFAALYSKEYDIETIGLRYMSIYGLHETSKGNIANLVSQFLWAMQKNERPIIYGDGSQTRDLTYVKDVCQANLLAATSKKKLLAEIFNVGTGRPVSLNALVDVLNNVLNKNIKPRYIKMPSKNYIYVQQAGISRINKLLGYKPQYTLERGVREMLSIGA